MNLDNLKQIRLDKELTQGEVAKMVGVSLMGYQLWERGHTKPTEENYDKLVKVLGED